MSPWKLTQYDVNVPSNCTQYQTQRQWQNLLVLYTLNPFLLATSRTVILRSTQGTAESTLVSLVYLENVSTFCILFLNMFMLVYMGNTSSYIYRRILQKNTVKFVLSLSYIPEHNLGTLRLCIIYETHYSSGKLHSVYRIDMHMKRISYNLFLKYAIFLLFFMIDLEICCSEIIVCVIMTYIVSSLITRMEKNREPIHQIELSLQLCCQWLLLKEDLLL